MISVGDEVLFKEWEAEYLESPGGYVLELKKKWCVVETYSGVKARLRISRLTKK